MKFDRIDIPRMESQRYKAIKNSGKYLELNVLIGAEDEEDLGGGMVSKMPVVQTKGVRCGSKEIGCLYMTLKSYIDQLEKDYPTECFVSKLAMKVQDIGTTRVEMDFDDEEE